jgi:type III secretory pathway component EscV/tetratricopeptide (TPR) repeat protein
MIERFEITGLLNASREEAAGRAHVDIGTVDTALGAIREVAARNVNVFELWDAIDEQIGKADTPKLRQLLAELRTRFEEYIRTSEVDRLKHLYGSSPDRGWREWLITIVQAITNFRLNLCIKLCEDSSFISGSDRQALGNIHRAVRYMAQQGWIEAYEQLDQLAALEFLPDASRGRLLMLLGQIQLGWFWRPARAKELFDAAEKLAPADGVVLSTLGEYWLGENRFGRALSYHQRAIETAPNLASGYIGKGGCFEKQSRFGEAAKWYWRATKNAAGVTSGYINLIKVYGRPEFFEKHKRIFEKLGKDQLPALIEQAIAVYPEDEYFRYLDLGLIYEQNSLYDEAKAMYEKAIALDPARPQGYIFLAQTYSKQMRDEEALLEYKKAIEAAPQCYNGYWELAGFYAARERSQDALEWYRKAPPHGKEWAGILRVEIARMQAKLGNWGEAESSLKNELRIDPGNESASRALENIAIDYYEQRSDFDSAKRIFADILAISGKTYHRYYHNYLGNLCKFRGEYREAVDEYHKAIAEAPDHPGYHRNLARASWQLKDYSRAREELECAFRIDQDRKAYNREMAVLLNEEANDYYRRGDYPQAEKRYSEAIRLDPSFAVIHANLGRAWEHLVEAGNRTQALDKAIEAFSRAQGINYSNEYKRILERLTQKRELVSRYSDTALGREHVISPIVMEVAGNLVPFTSTDKGGLPDGVTALLTGLRRRMWDQFGVDMPGVRFRGNTTDLPGRYVVIVKEIPLVSGTIDLDKRFFPGPEDSLRSLGVVGEAATNPQTGGEGFWIGRNDWEKLEESDPELWEVMEYPIRHLEAVICRNLREFVGHQEVIGLVERQGSQRHEDLRRSRDRLTALTIICRALVYEQVPLIPFAELYDEFNKLYSDNISRQDVVEYIRYLPMVRPRLPGNSGQLPTLRLGSRFEAEISNSIYRCGLRSVLAMEPERCQLALAAVRSCLDGDDRAILVVDNPDLRALVRQLIELEFPNVSVLSRRELLRTDREIEAARVIELEDDGEPTEPHFRGSPTTGADGELNDDDETIVPPSSGEITITVFVPEQFTKVRSAADDHTIEQLFSAMQDGLFYELGVVLPEFRVEIDHSLQANELRIQLGALAPASFAGLDFAEFLVNEPAERLKLLDVTGEAAINPASGNECTIVRGEPELLRCRSIGLTTLGPAGYLVLRLSAEIRRHAPIFQTLEITQYALDSLRAQFPDLVEAALRRFSVSQICMILKTLLDEEISILDLPGILENLLALTGTIDVDLDRYIIFTPPAEALCPVAGKRNLSTLNAEDYANFVRVSLQRYISYKYSKGGTLPAYLVAPEIERRIRDTIERPLSDEEYARLKRATHDQFDKSRKSPGSPVLLTTFDIRRRLRKILEADFRDIAVVAYQELSPDTNIQPLGRISWN